MHDVSQTKSIIVRAFELARSSSCQNTTEIQAQLKHEGYINIGAHFDAPLLKRQLSGLIKSR